MKSPETFESTRLIFTKIKEGDLEFFKRYLSDPELTRYLPLGKPYSQEEIIEYLGTRISHLDTHQFGSYLLTLKSSKEQIGYCGLEYVGETGFIDIRYGLMQKFWSKGLAKEAASRILEFGFNDLDLNMIYGVAVPANKASAIILRKIGMLACPNVDFYKAELDYYCMKHRDFQN